EPHPEVGSAKARGEGHGVALVSIQELDDGLGLAQRANPLVDPGDVDRVEDENRAACHDRVRGALQKTGLGPAETAVELVADLEAQSPRNVWYSRNTFRQMMTAAMAQAATLVARVLTSDPIRSRRLVKITSG